MHRHVEAKYSALLGHQLEGIFRRDNLECKLGVLDHDSLDSHSTDAPTAHNFGLGPVEVGAAEFGSCCFAAGVEFISENLAYVAEPEVVERFEEGVLLAFAGDVVEAKFSSLRGG